MTMDPVGSWAASPAGVAIAGVLGWCMGLLLARAVDAWFQFTGDGRVSRRMASVVAVAAAVTTGMLWWWEVRLGGPMAGGGADAIARCLAHMVLFWLLGAATWIDFRQRVIPDWITVPGVVIGLAAAWGWPATLPPVTVEVARTFAAPALEADMLAWHGGLDAGSSGAWGGSPHLPGLCLAACIYAAWWFVCTEPTDADRGMFRVSPRNALLAAGLAALAAAWWADGRRFDALQSGLVGLAVSGGLVWAVRAGGSVALAREAMGLGDVTLMAMVGAWLGWQACVLTFFLAAFIGLAHGIVQLVRHRESELPFGPSLCLAAAAVVVAWSPLWRATRVHFEEPAQLALVLAIVVVLATVTLCGWRWLRPAG